MNPEDGNDPAAPHRNASVLPVGGLDFRSLYPDPRERAALLYELVFRRLPEAAPDPDRTTPEDARNHLAGLLVEVAQKRRKSAALPPQPIPSDLAVEGVGILGHKALLYRLPHPEFLPGAYQMLVLAPGSAGWPRCIFLERTESPWGRNIGRLSFLDSAGSGRVDAGIVVQPNRESFLGGVEVALRSWAGPSGR